MYSSFSPDAITLCLYYRLLSGVWLVLDAVVVGCVIQRFREKKKLSQEVVSGFAGIGRTHLSAIERGERKPTLETFFRISEALQVRPGDLMNAIEDEMKAKEKAK